MPTSTGPEKWDCLLLPAGDGWLRTASHSPILLPSPRTLKQSAFTAGATGAPEGEWVQLFFSRTGASELLQEGIYGGTPWKDWGGGVGSAKKFKAAFAK